MSEAKSLESLTGVHTHTHTHTHTSNIIRKIRGHILKLNIKRLGIRAK